METIRLKALVTKRSSQLLRKLTPKKRFTSSAAQREKPHPITTMSATSSEPDPPCPPVQDPSATSSATEEQPLPKLTPFEFRQYNRMAEHMDYYHNHFRSTWNTLYEACKSQKRPQGMSIRQYISLGQDFCRSLEMHHGIEERHVFPKLAKRMPAFKQELELLTQHKQIHKGLEKMQKYLDECSSGERELRLVQLKSILDTFGTVLWQHLDDEVKQLGAENMRKYWTLEEMRRLLI